MHYLGGHRRFAMMPHLHTLTCALAALLASLAATPLAAAGTSAAGKSAQACRAFEIEAHGKPTDHFAHAAVIACREITWRKSIEQPLGERLRATDATLREYREAMRAVHRKARLRGVPAWAHGATAADKARIADETGMLIALDYIRDGY